MLNHEFNLNNKGVSNSLNSIEVPRHRWYYYKEGFSPTLVEHAVEAIDFDRKKDLIFDPFNGSGTVTLHSSLKGYNSVGFEVNPFASFISKTKQVDIDIPHYELEKAIRELINGCKKGRSSELEGFSTFSETRSNSKWLFNKDVLRSFHGGMNYVSSIRNRNLKCLLKLALINTTMENCNAKKDGKCLRYKRNWESLCFNRDTFLRDLQLNLKKFISDIQDAPILKKSNIVNGDTRSLLEKCDFRFKLCITSPPYLNSFDYTDVYRPELFLGKFIQSQTQLYNLRFRTLRSHVTLGNDKNLNKSFGLTYDSVISSIIERKSVLWHNKIPLMIQSYFSDMENIIKKLKMKGLPGSEIWIIVGNSAYANIEIPTDLIIAEIGSKAGLYLKEVGVLRHINKRGSKYSPDVRHLRESVVIFSKSKF